MNRKLTAVLLASAIATMSACDSDDDDDGGADGDNVIEDGVGGDGDGDGTAVSEPGTFQITVTNLTTNQPMTAPVVALHDPAANLFVVGEESSDAIRDIAETGDSTALVAFAADNPELVSDAGVAGETPVTPGSEVTISLSTELEGQVLSVANMVICTNDGISGVDSMALPADNEPVVVTALAYDAGTRVNEADSTTFFPPPCRAGDTIPVVEAVIEDPRQPIVAHPGQTGVITLSEGVDWDFPAGAEVLQIEVTRN